MQKKTAMRPARRRLGAMARQSPVLHGGLSLPFIAVACSRLDNALALCYLMAACLPVVWVGYLLRGRLSRPVKAAACALVGMVMVQLASVPLRQNPQLVERLGIYMPLICINMVLTSLALEEEGSLSSLLARGVAGFSLVACLLGALRESLALGTLLGFPLALPVRLPGLALPFAGLICLGLLCALLRCADRFERARAYRRMKAAGEGR